MGADPMAVMSKQGGDFEDGDEHDEQPTWANGEVTGERGVKEADHEDGEDRGPAGFLVGVGTSHGSIRALSGVDWLGQFN